MRTLNICSLQLLLLLLALILSMSCAAAAPAAAASGAIWQRQRRQIDLTLSAEHDDKDDETELALEAIAGLWSSADSRTKIDGSARVVHRANGMDTGAGQDWRLGVRVVFT